MAKRALLVAAMGVCVVACSPFGGGAFSCATDDQCGAGKCMSGYCSVSDSSCSSGYRYGDSSGNLSNTCVGATSDIDAATEPGIDSKVFLDAPGPDTTCFGQGFGKTCFANADVPNAPLTIPAGTINTDTSQLCSTTVKNNPGWCVIAASDLTLDTGTIVGVGGKPLVLLATGTLNINGTLDVASHRVGAQVGAASNDPNQCDAGTPPGNGGGGAGGSFGVVGAKGGNGGGTPGAIKPADAMRGGCPGQDGKGGTTPGVKGMGGGTVYLIANTKIAVGGAINASGASAVGGGSNNAGAGGGGSGGLIGLDSPVVQNGGAIFANGGGGAEGSGNSTKGNDGNESVLGVAAAVSGSASGIGGDGGGGGAAGVAAGVGQDGTGGGGGGGGGGVGAIRLFQAASITGGVVSPAAS